MANHNCDKDGNDFGEIGEVYGNLRLLISRSRVATVVE